MRLSTSSIQLLGVNAILAQQAKMSKTQLQLSTGQRLLAPSDDPAAAVRALQLNASLDSTTQYQANIGVTKSRLEFEDSTLDGVSTALQRARELTVQSLNGTLKPEDRAAIGQEVSQILDQVTGLANTKNANGEYLFAGFRSDTVPFAFDSGRTPPSYVYQGDKNQRQLQVGDQRPLADGDPGDTVFENVPSASGSSAIAAAGGQQSILNTLYSLSQALNGSFTASHGAVLGTKDLASGIDYSSGSRTVDLAVDGGAPTTVTIAAGTYASAEDLAKAINTGIAATSLSGTVVAQARSGHLEFVSQSTGAASQVVVSDGTGAGAINVSTDFGITSGQTGTGAAVTFNDAANAALSDIDAGLQRILDTRASIGARLNALDDQENVHSKFKLDTQTNLSNVQDLDYAEAISRYNQQQVALQAAQQAYVKVQGMSLFNYL